MNALQKVMKHYELTEWEDERDDALAIFTAAKEKLAALEAVAEIARIALVELQAIHDDWNRELSVDCVGIEHCTTAQTIAKLSAALGGVK